jgi:hypothetical protein
MASRGQEHHEDPADPLFSVPLSEFVTARDRLARDLKKAGRSEDASAVKALPKPTSSAWALNQTARKSPEVMARFLAASDALERAQTAGGKAAYQEALADQRKSLEDLIAATGDALTAAGVKPTRAVLERMANDLRWGALDPGTRRLLEAGRLLKDVAAPDFSALVERMGSPGKRPPEPPAARRGAPKPDGHDAAQDAAARKAQQRLSAAQDEHEEAKAALEKARTEEAEAERALAAAKKAIVEARQELARRERQQTDAERAHAAAEKAVAQAEKTEERLAAVLARAERDA